MNNYFNAFINQSDSETTILPEELYFTYSWLMWGPSYQNKYKSSKNKLIQYGYGDESNSINVVITDNEKSIDLWEKFCENIKVNNQIFGYNCSLIGKIIDTSEYYYQNYDKIDFDAAPFFKRLGSKKLGIPFLIELENYKINTTHKADNYFYSSYLWIMFSISDCKNPGFTPRKSVTFFEHANLANSNNYVFLANRLIDKCIAHFNQIANDQKLSERKYEYCLSMNSYIEKLFKDRINELRKKHKSKWYDENLKIDSQYTIHEVLDAFDNYFGNKETEVTCYELNIYNKVQLRNLCNFYAESYLAEFENSMYKFSLDQIIKRLKIKNKDYYFHFILTESPQMSSLGGIIAIYLPLLNCGIITGMAVNENHRSYGVGKSILNYAIQILRQDAVNCNKTIDCIVAPIELTRNDENREICLRFWLNNGFESALQKEKLIKEDNVVLYLPFNKNELDWQKTASEFVSEFQKICYLD